MLALCMSADETRIVAMTRIRLLQNHEFSVYNATSEVHASETKTNEWMRIRRRRRKKMYYLIAPFLVLNLSNKNRASRNNASQRKANKKRSWKKKHELKSIVPNKSITDSVSACVDSGSVFSYAALLRWCLNKRYSRFSTMVRWNYSRDEKKRSWKSTKSVWQQRANEAESKKWY